MALFKVIHNQTDHGLIIALREYTYYMINVQAINTAGNGPKSENYRTRTLRAGKLNYRFRDTAAESRNKSNVFVNRNISSG